MLWDILLAYSKCLKCVCIRIASRLILFLWDRINSKTTEHYQNWCRRNGYNFRADKAEKIYHFSSDLIAVFPKDGSTRMLIRQAVEMLDTASETVESLRLKMDELAATLPEYPVVMAMNGVGSTLGPRFNLSFTLWVLVAEKCTSIKYLVLSIFCCKQGVNRPVALV